RGRAGGGHAAERAQRRAGRPGRHRLRRSHRGRPGTHPATDRGIRQPAHAVRQAHRPLPGRAAATQRAGRTRVGRARGRPAGFPGPGLDAAAAIGRAGQGPCQRRRGARRRHRPRRAWRHRHHGRMRPAMLYAPAARMASRRGRRTVLEPAHRQPRAGGAGPVGAGLRAYPPVRGSRMSAPGHSNPLPLAGVRVLDLSRVLAGPWCTQTLADLGADVWKIEAPGRGDDTRSWTPPDVGGESTYFMCANRSKRSLAVDLRHPAGRALVQRLAAQADVLVENYRLGALAKFGLDYDTLSRAHPRLIYCSISGYGRTGPRAAEPGYDFVIQAESGLMSITGEPDGAPMKLGVAITDLVTGMNATQAILAALLARHQSGKGQLIDLALLDSAVSVLANVGAGYLAAGHTPQRFGNGHPTVVPYQIFATADGAFALGVGNDTQ